jgi:hypothetical protein
MGSLKNWNLISGSCLPFNLQGPFQGIHSTGYVGKDDSLDLFSVGCMLGGLWELPIGSDRFDEEALSLAWEFLLQRQKASAPLW